MARQKNMNTPKYREFLNRIEKQYPISVYVFWECGPNGGKKGANVAIGKTVQRAWFGYCLTERLPEDVTWDKARERYGYILIGGLSRENKQKGIELCENLKSKESM